MSTPRRFAPSIIRRTHRRLIRGACYMVVGGLSVWLLYCVLGLYVRIFY